MVSPLTPDAAPERALRHIVADCRADLLKYRAVVLRSRRAIGIHQTRVALRRMRAAFSLFAGAAASPLARREIETLAGEARWLAGECAPARDLHVLLTETLDDVPPQVTRVTNRLARLHLERARAALTGARFGMFEAALSGFIEHQPEAAGGRLDAFARTVLEARADKVAKRGRKIGSLDGKRLHRLRLAIKKLRDAAEFLRPAFASRAAKPYIVATARLQGALGAMNDHEVAARMLADIAGAARPTEDIARLLRKLARQAASGEKHRRRKLRRTWKEFEGVERFWRG